MAKNKYINFFKNKKVLITGGTGLIGMPLTQMLIDMGAKISIVSLDKKPKLNGKFKFLRNIIIATHTVHIIIKSKINIIRKCYMFL
jgi:FlaA1/EpsC-like NDP-sugar epimerase